MHYEPSVCIIPDGLRHDREFRLATHRESRRYDAFRETATPAAGKIGAKLHTKNSRREGKKEYREDAGERERVNGNEVWKEFLPPTGPCLGRLAVNVSN